jgi:hypothetical protein
MDESMDQGDQGEAFEHSRVLLLSFASRMTGSASEAEDLVQETRCVRRTGNAQPSLFCRFSRWKGVRQRFPRKGLFVPLLPYLL